MASRTTPSGEAGFTLAEMMVSILLMGIILAGLASTIMASIRATVGNERETRATAYAQQEIEVLQTIDWDNAGLYEDEVAAAPAEWSDRLSGADTFDGFDLITLPAADARDANVPLPRTTVTDMGVTYTIDRYATWVDRTENGTVDTRRFTVVASWDDRGADREITVTAERAPTQGDVSGTASGARVLQLSVSPNPAALDDDQVLTSDVRVRVILNAESVGTTRLYYHALIGDDTWELRSVAPTPDAAFTIGAPANTRFSFVIPAGTTRMVKGTQDVLFVGTDVIAQPIEAYAALQLTGGLLEGDTPRPPLPSDDTGPSYPNPPTPAPPTEPDDDDDVEVPDTDVSIPSATAVGGRVCVSNSTWVPSQNFVLDISTTGLTELGGVVTVTYQYRIKKNGNSDTANDGALFVSGNGDASTYRHTIAAGSNRRFQPGSTVTMTIDARRAGDTQNASLILSVPVVNC